MTMDPREPHVFPTLPSLGAVGNALGSRGNIVRKKIRFFSSKKREKKKQSGSNLLNAGKLARGLFVHQ